MWGEEGIFSALCCTGASARREGKSHFFHLGCLRRFLSDDLAAGTCPACSGVCCSQGAVHRCKTSTRCDHGAPPKAQRAAELEVLEGLVSMGSRTPRSAKRAAPRPRALPPSAVVQAPRPTARQMLPLSPPAPVAMAPLPVARAEPECLVVPYAMPLDFAPDLCALYCDLLPHGQRASGSDGGCDELMAAMGALPANRSGDLFVPTL